MKALKNRMGEVAHVAKDGRSGVGGFVNPATATLVEYDLAEDTALKLKHIYTPLICGSVTAAAALTSDSNASERFCMKSYTTGTTAMPGTAPASRRPFDD